jgi:hypothetical protein
LLEPPTASGTLAAASRRRVRESAQQSIFPRGRKLGCVISRPIHQAVSVPPNDDLVTLVTA